MSAAPARTPWLLALVLAGLTFWLYLPARDNGFVDYDDGSYVTQNADVRAGLTVQGVRWAFGSFHSANWHPLTWLSHMLDCELFGLEPAGHHLMGVAWHALAAALCLLALASLTGRTAPALVVAALFAAHPLRVESVAWVSERKDVLSGALFFATLLAWSRYVRAPAERRGRRYALVVLLLVLGLLAKPMLVTLPLLLLVLDAWPLRRWQELGTWHVLREKLPLLGLCIASGLATIFAQRAGHAVRSIDALPLGDRLANAAKALFAYPWKTLWPVDLAVFYPHPALVDAENFDPLGPWVIAGALGAVALTAVLWRLRARRPELLAGWAWYGITLLPVIGILQVGGQWMADRYAYLTTVGLYLGVVYALDAVLPTLGRRIAFGLGLALVIACVPVTRAQIGVWRDTRTLFENALAVTERNYVAHVNLGMLENQEAAHDLARLDLAEAHYRAAIAVAPRLPDAHSNLASILLVRGRLGEAREHLDRALTLDPRFTKARHLLALLETTEGRPEAALAAYREALRLDPGSVEAGLQLATALAQRGQHEEALALLRDTVARNPSHGLARVRLGEALSRSGDARGALAQLEAAVASATPPPQAREALVWLLATTKDERVRDGARAFRLGRELGDEWRARSVRAAAYAAVGELDTAYNLAISARDLAVKQSASRAEVAQLVDMVRSFKEGSALWL